MAPAIESMTAPDNSLTENGSSKTTVGIIYPPPEVRSKYLRKVIFFCMLLNYLFVHYLLDIVDKTATFVARNGQEFESRIRKNEINNPKFNFLNTGDPYHAYYQYKVKEIREGSTTTDSAPAPEVGVTKVPPGPPGKPPPPAPTSAPASLAQQQKQQEILKQFQQEKAPQIPKEPPPDFEFIVDPPSISAMEL